MSREVVLLLALGRDANVVNQERTGLTLFIPPNFCFMSVGALRGVIVMRECFHHKGAQQCLGFLYQVLSVLQRPV